MYRTYYLLVAITTHTVKDADLLCQTHFFPSEFLLDIARRPIKESSYVVEI